VALLRISALESSPACQASGQDLRIPLKHANALNRGQHTYWAHTLSPRGCQPGGHSTREPEPLLYMRSALVLVCSCGTATGLQALIWKRF